MGDVIPLFGDPPPAADDSEFVSEFSDKHLGNFIFAAQAMSEATTEQQFAAWMREVKRLVAAWPPEPE